jgi:hypothetical protein
MCDKCANNARSVSAMDTTTPPRPPMAHRSWYLRADVAESLADVVTDLHFTTRRPRHEVLAAVIEVAVGHRAEIAARLTSGSAA